MKHDWLCDYERCNRSARLYRLSDGRERPRCALHVPAGTYLATHARLQGQVTEIVETGEVVRRRVPCADPGCNVGKHPGCWERMRPADKPPYIARVVYRFETVRPADKPPTVTLYSTATGASGFYLGICNAGAHSTWHAVLKTEADAPSRSRE